MRLVLLPQIAYIRTIAVLPDSLGNISSAVDNHVQHHGSLSVVTACEVPLRGRPATAVTDAELGRLHQWAPSVGFLLGHGKVIALAGYRGPPDGGFPGDRWFRRWRR